MKRSIAAAAAVAAIAIALAGCSGTTDNGSGGEGETDNSDITIAYSSPNTGNNYHISFQCGVVQAAKDAGVNLTVSGVATFASSDQIPIINAAAAEGPDALIVAPTDATALVGPLQAIKAAGTKVIVYDTGLTDDSVAEATISADNEGGGHAAAQALVDAIGENGTVLIIDIAAGVVSTNNRAKGVIDELSQYPGITILDTQYDNLDPTKDAQIVDATLAAHPDLSAIIPVYNQAATGAVAALKANGKLGDVPVVTFDADPGIVQALRDGDLLAVVNQTPYEQAKVAVDDAIAAAKGETIAEKVVQQEMPVITQDNIDDPEITKDFYVDQLCNP